MKTPKLPKPFDPQKRHILLCFFILVFIIATPITILYAEGYRSHNNELIQTGGIDVTSSQTGVTIYLDGSEAATTLIFKHQTILSLIPGNYTVTVKKDGFYDFKTSVTVTKGEVTPVHTDLISDGSVFHIGPY